MPRTEPRGWLGFSLGRRQNTRGRASAPIRQMACHHSAIHMQHVAKVFVHADRKHHYIGEDDGR